MRKKLVAGNWKMHGSTDSVNELLQGLLQGSKDVQPVDLAVFPPFVYLPQTAQCLAGSKISWGGQNVSSHANGAYTGEVSTSMLLDFDCKYVLVGHSERRTLFADDNDTVANKFIAAKADNLIPVLCVGESLKERETGQTLAVISQQLQAVLSLEGGINLFKDAVVAYEPIWAIGTGLTATPEQAQEVHAAIRAQLVALDAEIGNSLRILYGGSVKANNAEGLFAMADIDGALVGGASLNPEEFLNIGVAAAKEVSKCNN